MILVMWKVAVDSHGFCLENDRALKYIVARNCSLLNYLACFDSFSIMPRHIYLPYVITNDNVNKCECKTSQSN
jgi:hypothetical protein